MKRTKIVYIRGMWLAFTLVLAVAMLGQSGSAQTHSLTNDDVIKMVKAQLAESVIIAKIKSSRCEFDTSPDALISLKQSGVSDLVLQSMAESMAALPLAPAGPRSGALLPTAFGYYVSDGSEMRGLSAVEVEKRVGLSLSGGGVVFHVDGFSGDPPTAVSTLDPTIIVYQQNLDVDKFRLSDLVYVSAPMKAYEFNIDGVAQNPLLGPDYNARLFRSLYGRDRSETIPVNLWRPKSDVPLQVQPVEGKPGMYRLIPGSPLQPGRYTLYLEGEIHHQGKVVRERAGERSQAFYFSVGGRQPTEPVDSRSTAPQPSLAVAASCNDYGTCTGVANAALRSSQFDSAPAAWDKILSLGQSLSLVVCHEKTFGCEQGNFSLGPKEISFTKRNGQKLFAVPASQVTPVGVEVVRNRSASRAAFRLKVEGKNYNFAFLPLGYTCDIPGRVLLCPEEGVAQQSAVADYILATLPKLASGALGPSPAPSE